MYKATITFAILATILSLCSAKPADVVARVPSSFHQGIKWVFFRDESIPDPPPNVIQADENVQVLPTFRYKQPEHTFPGYPFVSPAPIVVETPAHLGLTPIHQQVETAPVEAERNNLQDTVVVENKAAPQPQVQYKFNQGFERVYQKSIELQPPVVKVASFGVTAVPHTAVHIEGPAYYEYLRKKKNA